jgi:hypothetical protein
MKTTLTILLNRVTVDWKPERDFKKFTYENEDILFDEIYKQIKTEKVEDCYCLSDTNEKQYEEFRQFLADYYDEIKEQMKEWYWEYLDENK